MLVELFTRSGVLRFVSQTATALRSVAAASPFPETGPSLDPGPPRSVVVDLFLKLEQTLAAPVPFAPLDHDEDDFALRIVGDEIDDVGVFNAHRVFAQPFGLAADPPALLFALVRLDPLAKSGQDRCQLARVPIAEKLRIFHFKTNPIVGSISSAVPLRSIVTAPRVIERIDSDPVRVFPVSVALCPVPVLKPFEVIRHHCFRFLEFSGSADVCLRSGPYGFRPTRLSGPYCEPKVELARPARWCGACDHPARGVMKLRGAPRSDE